VTEARHALDLEAGLFALTDRREIARSLQRSAEASDRRKARPFPLRDVDAEVLHQPRGPKTPR